MQKTLRLAVILSVGVAALLGAYAVLFTTGDSSAVLRGIMSAISVAFTAGVGMAAWPLIVARRARPIAVVTLLLGLITLPLTLRVVWSEWRFDFDSGFWTVEVLSTTGALLCALLRAELLAQYVWVRVATIAALLLTSAFTVSAINGSRLHDASSKAFAAAGLLAGAGLIIVPILHGVTRRRLHPHTETEGPGLVRCPNCGHKLPASVSDVF